jgi:putative DNA primase/helicase
MEATNVIPLPRASKPRKSSALTELDITQLFVERFHHSFKYCVALGGWFAWTGSHWERDTREAVREAVKDVARTLAEESAALLDEELFKAAKRAGSAGGVDAILSLARSAPEIVFTPDDANRDPWLLSCRNGTIDIRTGLLRSHRREDLITRVCPVEYDPAATAPAFARFLTEIQPNPEARAYLARLFGYASVGLVREHVLAVFWGAGANGKSVLADVVSHALGGYAKPGPSTLIVANGHSDPHPTDVASLLGARLVLMHETKRGATFDASKVKLLTGGDRLTARHLYQDFFDFVPTHTLLMLSNYRPQADATDAALWRRVQLVSFDVVIPPEKRDHELAERIRGEAPGVLNWIIQGALEWQRMGLAPPLVVREQTERYRASEDVIGQFLDEHTVRMPAASVKAGVLYGAFKKWCDEGGQKPANGNEFGAEVQGRGIERVKRAAGYVYLGIGLHADSEHGGDR